MSNAVNYQQCGALFPKHEIGQYFCIVVNEVFPALSCITCHFCVGHLLWISTNLLSTYQGSSRTWVLNIYFYCLKIKYCGGDCRFLFFEDEKSWWKRRGDYVKAKPKKSGVKCETDWQDRYCCWQRFLWQMTEIAWWTDDWDGLLQLVMSNRRNSWNSIFFFGYFVALVGIQFCVTHRCSLPVKLSKHLNMNI